MTSKLKYEVQLKTHSSLHLQGEELEALVCVFRKVNQEKLLEFLRENANCEVSDYQYGLGLLADTVSQEVLPALSHIYRTKKAFEEFQKNTLIMGG